MRKMRMAVLFDNPSLHTLSGIYCNLHAVWMCPKDRWTDDGIRGGKILRENFPLIFSAFHWITYASSTCLPVYSLFTPLWFLPFTQRCLKSNLIYPTVIWTALLCSHSRFPPLLDLWAVTGSWLSASRLSSSGTPTSPL